MNDGVGLYTNHHTQGQQDDKCRRLYIEYNEQKREPQTEVLFQVVPPGFEPGTQGFSVL